MVNFGNEKAQYCKIATFSSNFQILHSRKNEQTLRHKKPQKVRNSKLQFFVKKNLENSIMKS